MGGALYTVEKTSRLPGCIRLANEIGEKRHENTGSNEEDMSLPSSGGAVPGTVIADALHARSANPPPTRPASAVVLPWPGPAGAEAGQFAGERAGNPACGLFTALVVSGVLWALIGFGVWWALS
jgi:hypothetical protein